MTEKTDHELIAAYFGGEKDALELLIARYLKSVFGFVYARIGTVADTEDVVQETFVKVWRHLKRFDRQKSFKTWVLTIAKNTALDFIKKKKNIPFSEFDTVDGDNTLVATLADPQPLADAAIVSRQDAVTMNETINKLDEPYRRVLTLRLNRQFTFREIADALHEPINTVKSRYRRGVLMVKDLLAGAS